MRAKDVNGDYLADALPRSAAGETGKGYKPLTGARQPYSLSKTTIQQSKGEEIRNREDG